MEWLKLIKTNKRFYGILKKKNHLLIFFKRIHKVGFFLRTFFGKQRF